MFKSNASNMITSVSRPIQCMSQDVLFSTNLEKYQDIFPKPGKNYSSPESCYVYNLATLSLK